jgi:hypothetical protein
MESRLFGFVYMHVRMDARKHPTPPTCASVHMLHALWMAISLADRWSITRPRPDRAATRRHARSTRLCVCVYVCGGGVGVRQPSEVYRPRVHTHTHTHTHTQ